MMHEREANGELLPEQTVISPSTPWETRFCPELAVPHRTSVTYCHPELVSGSNTKPITQMLKRVQHDIWNLFVLPAWRG